MRDEVTRRLTVWQGVWSSLTFSSDSAAGSWLIMLSTGANAVAEAFADNEGVWGAIIQLWMGFAMAVFAVVAITSAARYVSGRPKYLSDEDKARAQLFEALTKAENLARDIDETKQQLAFGQLTQPAGQLHDASQASSSGTRPSPSLAPGASMRSLGGQASFPKKNELRPQSSMEQDEYGERDHMGELRNTGLLKRGASRSMAEVQSILTTVEDPEDFTRLRPPWTVEALKSVLSSEHIPIHTWEQSAFETFASELRMGQARLRLRRGKPARYVDLLMLVIEHENEVLQEQVDDLRSDISGGFPPSSEKILATRMQVDEDMFDAQKRLLRKAGFPEHAVSFKEHFLDVTDTVESLDMMPNVSSIVRKFIIRVEVEATVATDLRKFGLPGGDFKVRGRAGTRNFKWMPKQQATGLLRYYARERASRRATQHNRLSDPHGQVTSTKSMNRTMDDCGEVLLPWTKEIVTGLCKKHSVESTSKAYGHPIDVIVDELNDGNSYFALPSAPDGLRMLLVRDVVSLLVGMGGDNVMVQTSSESTLMGVSVSASLSAELPSTLRYSDESCIAAARRVAQYELGAHPLDLCIAEAPAEQFKPAPDHVKAYDVEDWAEGERPPGRRLRHFVARGEVRCGGVDDKALMLESV